MRFEVPDDFESLQKIFDKTKEDAPWDISAHLEEPLSRMILRIGNSVLRFHKLTKLNAPKAIIESEIQLGQKYLRVMRMRSSEFIDHIHSLNTGPLLSNKSIKENIEFLCVKLTEEHHKQFADLESYTCICEQCGIEFESFEEDDPLCYTCREEFDYEEN